MVGLESEAGRSWGVEEVVSLPDAIDGAGSGLEELVGLCVLSARGLSNHLVCMFIYMRSTYSSVTSSRGPLAACLGVGCDMFRPCLRMLPGGDRAVSILPSWIRREQSGFIHFDSSHMFSRCWWRGDHSSAPRSLFRHAKCARPRNSAPSEANQRLAWLGLRISALEHFARQM